jgi:GGDEF domain-containing protein
MGGESLPDLSGEDEDIEIGAEPTTMLDLSAGPGRPPRAPCLIVTSGESALGLIFRLRGEMVIGRTIGCDAVLAEADVSRRHARVTVRPDGAVEIADLGSSNGVIVEGKRVTSALLHEGAHIEIGRATLVLVQMDDVDALVERNQHARPRDAGARLPSRRHFLDALAWEVAQRRGPDDHLVVACCAVDDLAALGDTRGQGVAQGLVYRLGSVIAETLRDPDVKLGRTADDEVSVVFLAESRGAARLCGELICRQASRGMTATVSVGIAVAASGEDQLPASLFAAAQKALLHAKASGGGVARLADL